MTQKVTLDQIKSRYKIIMRWKGTGLTVPPEDQKELQELEGFDIYGWLLAEIDSLNAIIEESRTANEAIDMVQLIEELKKGTSYD